MSIPTRSLGSSGPNRTHRPPDARLETNTTPSLNAVELAQPPAFGLLPQSQMMTHDQCSGPTNDEVSALSPQALREALQNLRVHQIELKMQNDGLRATQAALDVAQARYFDFYDLAPVGYVTVSDQLVILQANLTTAALLDVPRADLIGKALPGFMALSDADRCLLMCQRALTGVGMESCELCVRKPDGDAVWVQLQAIAATNDDGAAVIRMVLIDISERIQTEALRQTNQRLRDAVLDSVPLQIAVLDRNGIVLSVNAAWRDFALDNSPTSGQPASHTSIGTNYLDISRVTLGSGTDGSGTDGSAALARDGILRVIQGSAPSFHLEYPCHSPTQQRWFSLAVTPLHLENQSVVVIHTDITQRRQLEQTAKEASEYKISLAESDLRNGERHYQELIAGFPVGVLLHGQNSEILLSNSMALELLGLTEDQLLGKTSFDSDWNVIHEDGTPFLGPTHPVPQAIASRQPVRNVVMGVFRPTTQDRVWLLVNAIPQLTPDANVRQVVCIISDITESKSAEGAMLETNLNLAQARQQLRELLALNETTLEKEKRHIAREVHDELGQVLTALGMYLSVALIRHAADAPELRDALNSMKIQLDRAVQGVRNVANSLRPAALDMGLATAIEWLCQEFTKHGEVDCSLHGFDELLEINESRGVVIFRIVQEALTNIRKYAQASQVDITLERRAADLSVEIRDNGVGFDLVAVAQRGTLGLLGMQERVIALSGCVKVSSSPGQGTTITVLIPLESNAGKDSP